VLLIGAAVALNTSLRSPLSTELGELVATVTPEEDVPPQELADVRPVPAVEPASGSDDQISPNWPRFRGPGGRGISLHRDVPTSWDGTSGQGILWKTKVPLPGNNSPVVWDDRVFLSGATEENRQVYCFAADTGQLLWQKDVPVTSEGSGKPLEVMEDTGYAASTTTTDGSRVFAIFPNGDVVALDFDGNQLWIRGLGIPDNAYGHASSLAMCDDRVLVQFDQGSRKDKLSKLIALDAATGQTVWETPREVPNSWPTPIVVEAGDRDQVITAADPWVIAYDPADGQEIWRAKCLSQDVGPSPTFADGIVYVANEFPALSAIRADGEGDVTDSHILWEGEDGLPDTSSPLATERYVYVLASYGILTCYDAKSGEMLWDTEFEGDPTFTSSPSLVGDLLYLFGEIEEEDGSGDWVTKCRAWVVKPGPEGCESVGQGSLPEGCVTSPAFQNGRVFIRGEEHLFCIGKKQESVAKEEPGRNWPRFRGPGGRGISDHKDVPTAWDGNSGDGIRWKTEVPLPGNNSPVVWDKKLFLSGATEQQRQVYCFDVARGEILWKKDVPPTPEGTGEPLELMEDTGYAASTMTTDGQRVLAIFPNGDAVAFDLDGNQLWIRGFGIPDNSYGHASSLAMYQDRLLIQLDQGSRDDKLSKLLALDGATGETVWEAPREVPNSWPTPIVINVDGRDQIVTGAAPWVIAYDAADGTEIWRAKCLSQDVGPSPTFADGIVYVANEFPALSAIRADGEGDVTESHVLWEGEDGLPDTASPLATEKYVLVLASYGILTCYDAKSGEMLWDKEFEDAMFTSSPSLVGDLLYLFGEIEEENDSGDWIKKCRAWVLKPGPEGCQLVGEGSLPEGCVTSPAFQDGTIYIRGEQHLYCIGKE
jgi:outer membrane protein assembly factor BamB